MTGDEQSLSSVVVHPEGKLVESDAAHKRSLHAALQESSGDRGMAVQGRGV